MLTRSRSLRASSSKDTSPASQTPRISVQQVKHHCDSGATIHAIYQRCECNADIISDAETAIVRKLIKRFNKWRSEYLKW